MGLDSLSDYSAVELKRGRIAALVDEGVPRFVDRYRALSPPPHSCPDDLYPEGQTTLGLPNGRDARCPA